MNFFKRIFLFCALNFAICLSLGFIFYLVGGGNYIRGSGLSYYDLGLFCIIWGFGGAFISLMLSRVIVKSLLGIKLVNSSENDSKLRRLHEMVQDLTIKAGLPMPQVGIYNSEDINAFATGPTRKRSLVAVSTALLQFMSEKELEAILAHEVSHIRNGDMVTMTLLQGAVNAFAMFVSRILAFLLSSRDRRNSYGLRNYFMVMIFQTIFLSLGTLVICAYSRRREYSADFGGATLSSKENMINALKRLKEAKTLPKVIQKEPAFLQALKISQNQKGLLYLLRTHPLLDDRIERLQKI